MLSENKGIGKVAFFFKSSAHESKVFYYNEDSKQQLPICKDNSIFVYLNDEMKFIYYLLLKDLVGLFTFR